jgi:parallel beta-helix repeat protein
MTMRPRLRTAPALALASLLAATLAHVGEAAGATLYVDQSTASCSDAGGGTSGEPFCTIGAAAAKAIAGDTVIVAEGSYGENVTVANSGTSSAPIVFTVAPGATVFVTGGTHGFTVSGKSWITIDGFEVGDTIDDAISVSSSSHVTVRGNHASFAGSPSPGKIANGIRFSGVSDSSIEDNVADHNTNFGIFLTGGSTRVTVTRNVVSQNARQYTRAAAGIDLYGSDDNLISFNVAHDNEDSGIELRAGSSGNLVVGNVAYGNGDHGIDVTAAPSQRIISNTVYENVTSGINVEGGSTGTTIANNVSVDNALESPRSVGNIRVDSRSTAGTVLDYDLVHLRVAGTMIVWGSSSHSSLASFQSATGQESHGLQASPRFEAASSGDLRLLAGSPAIDSADSGASGATAIDADGNARVDDPSTPDTGSGPRSYDDRGAYEFQGDGGPTPTPTPTTTPAPNPTPTPTPMPSATPTESPTPMPTATPTPTPPPGATPTATPSPAATPTPGGQDFVGNPGFETDTSGWSVSGSGTVLDQVSGGRSGSFAARLSNGGSGSTGCTLNDSPNWVGTTSAGTYTGRLWVRADVAGAVLKLRFREYAGSTLAGTASTQVALGTSWQEVAVAYAPVSPGASTLDFNAYVSSAPPGVCFYADDASIVLQ